MPRPKSLKEIELVPDIVINPDHYRAGFKGTLDEKGRMSQAVGKEYARCEFYVFIKKGGNEKCV